MVLSRGGKTKKIRFFDKISACQGTHCSLLMYLCRRNWRSKLKFRGPHY
jgi:hypothetical protein